MSGIIWIIIGVIIAGNALNIWHISLFFTGWWTLFIIVPCALKVKREGFRSGAGLGLVFGLLLLASQLRIFTFGTAVKLAIPVLLIGYGAKLILGNRQNTQRTQRISEEVGTAAGQDNNSGAGGKNANYTAIFSGQDIKYPRDLYFGSDINAVFGGADIDLREALIDSDIVINVTAIFGGADIKLPKDVNVHVHSTGIFGGTDNRVKRPECPEWPIVTINSTAIFGGVEIR